MIIRIKMTAMNRNSATRLVFSQSTVSRVASDGADMRVSSTLIVSTSSDLLNSINLSRKRIMFLPNGPLVLCLLQPEEQHVVGGVLLG